MLKERDLFADFVKGLLILSVVLGHTLQNFKYCGDTLWGDYLVKYLWMFNMPLFIGVSGYFTFFSLRRKPVKVFLKERFLYLFIPMFIWVMIMGGVGLASSKAAIPDKLFFMYAMLISSYWFIWAILIGSVIVGVLKVFNLDNKYIVGVVALLCMLAPSPLTNAVLAFSKSMMCFFMLGYMLASFDLSKIYQVCKKYLWLILVLTAICYYFWEQKYLIYFSPSDIFHLDISAIRLVACTTTSVSFLIMMRMFYDYVSKGKVINKITQFGQETLGIYLVQAVLFFAYYYNHRISEDLAIPSLLYLIPVVLMVWGIYIVIKQTEKVPVLSFLLFGKKK